MNMREIELLKTAYNGMVKFRLHCNSLGSRMNYQSDDFDLEGKLLWRIRTLKDKGQCIY